jgi:hypothetical protein
MEEDKGSRLSDDEVERLINQAQNLIVANTFAEQLVKQFIEIPGNEKYVFEVFMIDEVKEGLDGGQKIWILSLLTEGYRSLGMEASHIKTRTILGTEGLVPREADLLLILTDKVSGHRRLFLLPMDFEEGF